MIKKIITAVCLITSINIYAASGSDSSGGGDVIINIYGSRPEQRQQSRWNLFDWMQTKQKIKMWDTWLEHNGGKNFLPEFSLAGFYTFSDIEGARANYFKANFDSYFLPLKFADFGINLNAKSLRLISNLKDMSISASGLFRIFGNNVQNTGIVLKAGYSYSELAMPGRGINRVTFNNFVLGSEIQLYLIDHIGLKGSVDKYLKAHAKTDASTSLSVFTYFARAFVEYKSIRIEGGYYTDYNTVTSSTTTRIKTRGWVIGMQQAF